jgi:hypothetical protein
MKKTKDGQYFYQIWKDDELLSETPTDALNYENFYWYDGTFFSTFQFDSTHYFSFFIFFS